MLMLLVRRSETPVPPVIAFCVIKRCFGSAVGGDGGAMEGGKGAGKRERERARERER